MATMDLTPLPVPVPAGPLASPLTALHLGPLHPAEQALVYLLAFGPFAVLALVVVVRRRQDRREQGPAATPPPAGPQRDVGPQRDR
jgi:hypothetical protein